MAIDYLPTLAEAPVAAAIPGELERRQRERIAAALMAQGGSGEPIAHWSQGLNRVAQGLVGGYQLGELRRQGQAEEARTQAILAGLPGLQGAGPPSAAIPQRAAESDSPAAPPTAPVPPPQRVAALGPPSAGSPQARIDAGFADTKTAIDAGIIDPQGAAYPKTLAGLPPSPGMSPAGAVPVQTQSFRPPQAGVPPAAAAPPPAAMAEMQLARALMANQSTRAAGLQMYMRAVQQMQPNFGFQVVGDQLYRTDPRSGRADILGSVSKPPTYGVIGEDQFGNKQYGWIDPTTRSTTPGAAGRTGTGAAAAGGTAGEPVRIAGPDGTLHTVPPNQDPKKFRDTLTTITAEAVGGKSSEGQSKASRFASRMELAEPGITETQNKGLAWFEKQAGRAPFDVGRFAQSEERIRYDAFKDRWISGFLRADSGAVINPSEYRDADNQFFPQPGDTAKVITDKQEARRVAAEAMKKEAGPGYKSPPVSEPTVSKGEPSKGRPRAKDKAGNVVEWDGKNWVAVPK